MLNKTARREAVLPVFPSNFKLFTVFLTPLRLSSSYRISL
nr:MAG TPA: hypothetical protein [Caudoviricetes sp.]